MITLIQFKCSKCNYRGSVYFPIRATYRMPDGIMLDTGQALTWCNTCNRVTNVESMPDMEAVERLLALPCLNDSGGATDAEVVAMRRYLYCPRLPNISLVAAESGAWSAQRLGMVRGFLERQREFLQIRQAPAKCLRCATSDFGAVSHWRKIDPPLVHGGCGGTIKMGGSEAGSMDPVIYSVEGERLS